MADTGKEHLVFASGAGLFAVPADRASEVVNVPKLTRVPGAPAHVIGVFAHRGEVLPVVDLSLLLGSAPTANPKRVVVFRVAKGAVAVAALKVAGVTEVDGSQAPLGGGVKAHLRGPVRAALGDVVVVDPEGLFEFLSAGA